MAIKDLLESVMQSDSKKLSVILLIRFWTEEAGENSLMTNFVKRVQIPECVVHPGTKIGFYINGGRYAFENAELIWDEKAGAVFEIKWPVANDQTFLRDMAADSSWEQGPFMDEVAHPW